MLDKSIPYYHVIMVRPQGTPFEQSPLPEGFRFSSFQTGDELAWAAIETSVGEFDDVATSVEYFSREYLPFADELKRRLVFVENSAGEKVATATAWWSPRNETTVPSLHWIATRPEYQGLGLGKAGVGQALEKSIQLDGDRDNFLHTQTWSYTAVGIYMRMGFRILVNGSFAGFENDYHQAKPHLEAKLIEKFPVEEYSLPQI